MWAITHRIAQVLKRLMQLSTALRLVRPTKPFFLGLNITTNKTDQFSSKDRSKVVRRSQPLVMLSSIIVYIWIDDGRKDKQSEAKRVPVLPCTQWQVRASPCITHSVPVCSIPSNLMQYLVCKAKRQVKRGRWTALCFLSINSVLYCADVGHLSDELFIVRSKLFLMKTWVHGRLELSY